MVITYNIGVLGAELKLTLLSSINGSVVRHNLRWVIIGAKKTVSSEEALPLFRVPEGEYLITADFEGQELTFTKVKLLTNTRTDMVFILPEGQIKDSDDYFVDYDPNADFARRQEERELQSNHGFAEYPLRNPNNKVQGEMGSPIDQHPLLNTAQFDGVPPEIRPDPHENSQALQLELASRLTASPSANPTPTLTR